jgi:hypothetical protein
MGVSPIRVARPVRSVRADVKPNAGTPPGNGPTAARYSRRHDGPAPVRQPAFPLTGTTLELAHIGTQNHGDHAQVTTDNGPSGYPLKRTWPGQAARQGRAAWDRSRLGGCPTPPGVVGGFLAGVVVTMRSW